MSWSRSTTSSSLGCSTRSDECVETLIISLWEGLMFYVILYCVLMTALLWYVMCSDSSTNTYSSLSDPLGYDTTHHGTICRNVMWRWPCKIQWYLIKELGLYTSSNQHSPPHPTPPSSPLPFPLSSALSLFLFFPLSSSLTFYHGH